MIFFVLIRSLLSTLLLEVPLALAYKIPLKRAVLVNILTNPPVVMLYHLLKNSPFPTPLLLLLLEGSAFLVEGYFYRGYIKRPYVFSFFANGFSYGVGFLVQWWFF